MGELWQFLKSSSMEEFSFNKVLEKFYDFGITGLVRENIQNSLDGKLQGIDGPVIVQINIGTISKNDIPGLDEIKSRINCLEGRNNYTRETIEHMKNKMDDNLVSYISFEDSNTKGLAGAKHGQTYNPKDTWSIYAYNKGVHGEEDDETLEKSRGGSHGIGKIASNAASDLYMMYFSNCDEFGNKHIGGTVQLIEHEYKSNFYRATGYFTNIEQDRINPSKTKFIPHENTFDHVFKKDTRGLKIIIPFLREQFNNEDEIIRSVCDSFFVAILDKKLEVEVNGKEINDQNIDSYIKNPKYYDQDISNIKKIFTTLYFDTYTKEEPRSIKINSKEEEYEFDLYFKYDEKIQTGRVGIVRTIGMKIEDKKIKSNVRRPFNAVLIPKTAKEDEFLKSLENESHTELSCDHIKDIKLQKSSKTFINNISKEIAKIIEEEIRKNNPTDGKIDTSDIIYELNAEFKDNLLNKLSTVKIKNKKKKNKKKKDQDENKQPNDTSDEIEVSEEGETVISMTSSLDERKEVEPDKNTGTHNSGNSNNGNTKDINGESISEFEGKIDQDGKEERVLHQGETNIAETEDPEIEYKVSTTKVERIVIADNEFIKFNLSQMKEVRRVTTCDIGVSIIDGEGKELKNNFKMKDNYVAVTDLMTNSKLKIQNDFIKNVTIEDGIASLKIELKPEYNRTLKFVYYVGV